VRDQPPNFDAPLTQMRDSASDVGEAADPITVVVFVVLIIQIIVGLIRSDY